MNKYQEAFERLTKHTEMLQRINFSDDNSFWKDNYLQDKQILQEPVEKATPKKIVYINNKITNLPVSKCPNCGIIEVFLENFNYCHNCGQRLERSEEDV